MKKFLSIVLAVMIVICCVPMSTNASAAENKGTSRYTVLVMDISGESSFYSGSTKIYTASSSIDYVRTASVTFLQSVIRAQGDNHVAVVTYSKYSNVLSDFSTDIQGVSNKVRAVVSDGSDVRDINSGLKSAKELLNKVEGDVKKSIVLVTTGFTNQGDYSYSGHYDSSVVGSDWYRTNTKVKLYAYANAALATADDIKKDTVIYVTGLFQTMNDIPEAGKSVAELFRLTAKDLATSEATFKDVANPNDFQFAFDSIAEEIIDPGTGKAILGDVNFDGKVNSDDSLVILRASVGLTKFTNRRHQIGNVNFDDKINSLDSLMVLRYSVGINDNDKIGKEFDIVED